MHAHMYALIALIHSHPYTPTHAHKCSRTLALTCSGYPGIPSLDILDNVIPYISGEVSSVASVKAAKAWHA